MVSTEMVDAGQDMSSVQQTPNGESVCPSRNYVTFPRSRLLTLPPLSSLMTSSRSNASLDSNLSETSLELPLLDSAQTLVAEAVASEEAASMTSKRQKKKRNCVRRKRKSLADVFLRSLSNASMTSLATESTSGYCSPDTALTHLRSSSFADVTRTDSYRYNHARNRECVSLYDTSASISKARLSCGRSVVSAQVSLYDNTGQFSHAHLSSSSVGRVILPPWKSRRNRRLVVFNFHLFTISPLLQ